MRKDFGAKPFTYPQPVLILGSYDKDGNPDAMNAAWGGISGGNEISMCISVGHKSTKNILERKAFTVSMADLEHAAACDYVGLVSAGNTPDKFKKAGFHAVKSKFVDAPLIEELPIAAECRLKSYDANTGRMVGEIVLRPVQQHLCCPRRGSRKGVQRRQLAQIKIYAKRPARFRAGHFVFRM